MKWMRPGTLVISTILLTLAGCAGGAYRDKCEAACQPDDNICDSEQDACIDACITATEGLLPRCAQCMVEHTRWDSTSCECRESEGGGSGGGGGGGGADSSMGLECFLCSGGECINATPAKCASVQPRCNGFEIGKAAGDECDEACQP